jgi:hypothetical protein
VAQLLSIGGQTYKRRNAVGVWFLSLITLVIYYFVWYYRINSEARRFLNDTKIQPFVSLLAVLFGWILIVPPFISVYRTAKRVQRMQLHAGLPATITPWVALALEFVVSLHIVYLQAQLNRVWDHYRLAPPPQPVPVPAQLPPPPPLAPA